MAVTAAAMAVERVAIEAGTGDDVNIVGVEVSSSEWRRGVLGRGWSWSLYGKVGVARWEGRNDDTAHKHLVDLTAYPVLRLDSCMGSSWSPYIEAGIGAHLLSKTRINDRRLSTAFQFGEFVGVGWSIGPKRKFDLGIRVQHLSNASIKKPNPGLTYGSLVLQYRFDTR